MFKIGDKIISKKPEKIKDKDTEEVTKESKNEDTNKVRNDLLSNLTDIESQLKSLLEKNSPIDEREKKVLKNINSLVKGFI